MPKKTCEVDVEVVPRSVRAELLRRKGRSLRPDINTMNAYIKRQPEAVAIIESWRFNQPIQVLELDEFRDLVERGRVTFNG